MYTSNTRINNQLITWLSTMFFIVSIMIIVGGLTRLTDSGLSITEWELFSGFFPPLSQNEWILYFNLYKGIPEFKLQNFDMTLQEFKIIFWWEWAHRFLGRLIGIGYLLPLIYFSFKIKIVTPIKFSSVNLPALMKLILLSTLSFIQIPFSVRTARFSFFSL